MDTGQAVILLVAIVAGGILQWVFAYRQSTSFTRAAADLRRHGTVAVGAAGKRYRGGRAYVAIAFDPTGRVTSAITLSGWTNLARPRRLQPLIGLRVNVLRGDRPVEGLTPPERAAAREAGHFAVQRDSLPAPR